MARHTSASHFSWCLAVLLGSGLAQASAQGPPDDLSGTWGSNIGVTYTITQSGTQITWVDVGGVRGTIVATPTGLSTTWSDATGQHSATGTVVERDGGGRPTKIAWSNGVVMQRADTFGFQIAKPAYQVVPPAPAPQPTPGVQGVHLQATTLTASTLPAPQGPYTLLLSISGLTDRLFPAPGVVRLGSTSLRVALGGQPAAGSGVAGPAMQRTDLWPISISKPVDVASPALMEAAAKGTSFPSVRISVIAGTPGVDPEIMVWTLQQVVVLSYTATAESGAQASGPIEELTLDYAEITYQFNEIKTTGGVGMMPHVTVHR